MALHISSQLVEKYNTPVPRYTSYPPANYFTENYSASDYIKAIEESNSGNPQNISFYVHIPFCIKSCFYCGCNHVRMKKTENVREYVDVVKKEIGMVLPMLDKNRKVSQIHYGGGTPNAIDAAFLAEINQLFFDHFAFIDNPEIAIECNPAYLDEAYIDELMAAGFNRFSLGIQDFDTKVLDTINRDASAIPVKELVELMRSKKKDIAVNLDFIYGLPGQTEASFLEAMEKAIDVHPDRLVTFAYAHVPWIFKAQQALEKAGLPSSEEKNNMFLSALQKLEKNGYATIGMDHYALETDELTQALKNQSLHRNFQGYCTRRTTGQVYAFGSSSISQLERDYAQNEKSVPKYIERIKNDGFAIVKGQRLSNELAVTREVITELMCNRQINWEEIATLYKISADELKTLVGYDVAILDGFVTDGILEYNNQKLQVYEDKLLFLRNVAAAFDPLMKNSDKKFSKPM